MAALELYRGRTRWPPVTIGGRMVELRNSDRGSGGEVRESSFHWDVVNVRAMGQYLTRVEGRFIQQLLAARPRPQLVLDIGGGSGRFAVPLYEAGYQLLVLDVDATPLRILVRSEPGIGRALVSGRSDELPIADDSVDCVLCIEVPVLDDPATFLAACRRVLRTGGVVIFTAHNRRSYKGLLKQLTSRRQERRYYGETYLHTISEIRAQLRAFGFSLFQECGFNWIPFTRDADTRLVWAAARLERALGLDRLVQWSPWVLVAAQKSGVV
jgi:ubiquinone/menaquinone biosynthesis C-methylase UbiE